MIQSKESFIFNQIAKEYPAELRCAKLIESYVKNTVGENISKDELLYLIIHIVRITKE